MEALTVPRMWHNGVLNWVVLGEGGMGGRQGRAALREVLTKGFTGSAK